MRYKIGDIVRYDDPYECDTVGIVTEFYHPLKRNGEPRKKLLVRIKLFNELDPHSFRSIEINNTNWKVLNG